MVSHNFVQMYSKKYSVLVIKQHFDGVWFGFMEWYKSLIYFRRFDGWMQKCYRWGHVIRNADKVITRSLHQTVKQNIHLHFNRYGSHVKCKIVINNAFISHVWSTDIRKGGDNGPETYSQWDWHVIERLGSQPRAMDEAISWHEQASWEGSKIGTGSHSDFWLLRDWSIIFTCYDTKCWSNSTGQSASLEYIDRQCFRVRTLLQTHKKTPNAGTSQQVREHLWSTLCLLFGYCSTLCFCLKKALDPKSQLSMIFRDDVWPIELHQHCISFFIGNQQLKFRVSTYFHFVC